MIVTHSAQKNLSRVSQVDHFGIRNPILLIPDFDVLNDRAQWSVFGSHIAVQCAQDVQNWACFCKINDLHWPSHGRKHG
jgi:hypothetical protein